MGAASAIEFFVKGVTYRRWHGNPHADFHTPRDPVSDVRSVNQRGSGATWWYGRVDSPIIHHIASFALVTTQWSNHCFTYVRRTHVEGYAIFSTYLVHIETIFPCNSVCSCFGELSQFCMYSQWSHRYTSSCYKVLRAYISVGVSVFRVGVPDCARYRKKIFRL